MAIETRTEYATCWKCNGSGRYLHYGRCFTCWGTGKNGRKRRVAVNPADQPALDAQKARARERAQEKRAESAAKVWEKNVADYPFLAEADERGGLWHVAADILFKARRYPISEKQAAVVQRSLERAARDDERNAEREAEAALRSPAPEGRLIFTGTVEWTGLKDSQYGVTRKIRVLTDDGWACYGTAPASIIEVEAGNRVTMTATLKPTDDDPTFAWFSRPAKATLTQCEALAA
jgi:hypothetical protein